MARGHAGQALQLRKIFCILIQRLFKRQPVLGIFESKQITVRHVHSGPATQACVCTDDGRGIGADGAQVVLEVRISLHLFAFVGLHQILLQKRGVRDLLGDASQFVQIFLHLLMFQIHHASECGFRHVLHIGAVYIQIHKQYRQQESQRDQIKQHYALVERVLSGFSGHESSTSLGLWYIVMQTWKIFKLLYTLQ